MSNHIYQPTNKLVSAGPSCTVAISFYCLEIRNKLFFLINSRDIDLKRHIQSYSAAVTRASEINDVQSENTHTNTQTRSRLRGEAAGCHEYREGQSVNTTQQKNAVSDMVTDSGCWHPTDLSSNSKRDLQSMRYLFVLLPTVCINYKKGQTRLALKM